VALYDRESSGWYPTRFDLNPLLRDRNCGLKPTAELHTRVEELESLKDQMQTLGISIAKAVSGGALIINHDTDPFPLGNVYW